MGTEDDYIDGSTDAFVARWKSNQVLSATVTPEKPNKTDDTATFYPETTRNDNPNALPDAPPVVTVEAGGATASPPSRLWIYLGIGTFLCLGIIVYFARKASRK